MNHHNVSLDVYDSLVVKTTLRAFSRSEAGRLEGELIRYTALLEDEPIAVPKLHGIRRLIVGRNRSKLQMVYERNNDNNLQTMPLTERIPALSLTLDTIAQMRLLRDTTLLRTPVDAIAANLHVATEAGTVTLVDTFPPLPRDDDETIPLQNVRFGRFPLRRSHVNFFRGTRSGAILRAMMSVSLGTTPLQRVRSVARDSPEWCHDLVPDSLTGDEKDMLHREINQRFIGQVMLGGTAGALHYAEFKITGNPDT